MATVTTHNDISAPTGYSHIAAIQYGWNGDLFGPPEFSVGATGNLEGAHVVWDEDPSDGVDSEWVDVALTSTTSNTTLDVKGENVQASGSMGAIAKVEILAGTR